MDKYKDKAITIIQTLMNATGAEFEDQNMAIDIIAGNLEIENKNNAVGESELLPNDIEVGKMVSDLADIADKENEL